MFEDGFYGLDYHLISLTTATIHFLHAQFPDRDLEYMQEQNFKCACVQFNISLQFGISVHFGI